MIHTAVLKKEVLEFLAPEPGENFVDCTVGEGGHAEDILNNNKPSGKLLGIDLDPQQIGLCGSPTQVVKIFTPTPRVGGQILKGEVPDVVKQLVDLIKDEVN